MTDWKKPLEHKKNITINVLIKAPDRKSKTMKKAQESLWAAEDEIKQKLEEINERYENLIFKIEGAEKLGVSKRKRSDK